MASSPSLIQYPDSAPAPGQIPAYDAGWNAHEVGLERETVRVLTPESGREWALLAWDVRQKIAEGTRVEAQHECGFCDYGYPMNCACPKGAE